MLKPSFHKYEQRVFDAYKSFDGEDVQNLEIKQPALFGKMTYIFMFIIFPFCVWYGFHNYNNHANVTSENSLKAPQPSLISQNTHTYLNNSVTSQNETYTPVVDRNLSVWVSGLVFISIKNYFVLLRMADGRQFTSKMIDLSLDVTNDGHFIFDGRVLHVGSWIGLSSYQVDRLPPVEHSTMPAIAGFKSSSSLATSFGY